MLETVRSISREYKLVEIAGVLNGTCNFILDRIAHGHSLKEAIGLAQSSGFTEADPTQDLQATDAAQKLLLLTRTAFGAQAVFNSIQIRGILSVPETEVRNLAAAGQTVRLVAKARRNGIRIDARVCPEILSADDSFAQVHDEQNCLVLKTACGQSLTVSGRGAGRWPTAEAVFADALDLWRNHQAFNTGRQSHNEKTYVWSAAAGEQSPQAESSSRNSSAGGTLATGGAA